MRRLSSIFSFVLVACGPPPTATVSARISADPALSSPFTTEDGWTLSFTHVVVEVSSFVATGGGVSAFVEPMNTSKTMDFVVADHVDLGTNAAATPKSYDTLSIVFSHTAGGENVNVDSGVLAMVGGRTLYVEGTATRQSTTRRFQLALPMSLTYESCMPAVKVDALGTATLDFRLHPQRLFFDDQGKMRFEAWALADTSPTDGSVLNAEASAVQTSTLPMAQYGATMGTLFNVFEKRALQLVGVGDTGTCVGR